MTPEVANLRKLIQTLRNGADKFSQESSMQYAKTYARAQRGAYDRVLLLIDSPTDKIAELIEKGLGVKGGGIVMPEDKDKDVEVPLGSL